jgi:hypothetical protein
MSAETIGDITAELVQCGIPRQEEGHPDTKTQACWWIYTDTDDERIECIHIQGKTENDEKWQLEVVCDLHGFVEAVNAIEAFITEVMGSLAFWPGLPTAIELALLAQRLSDAYCEDDEDDEDDEEVAA